MEDRNQTTVIEFILNGFSTNLSTRIVLFGLFLLMYILTLCGNVVIICTVMWSPQMHTPMYYFLCILSFLDVFYSSNTVPKMLGDIFLEKARISFGGCMLQMCATVFLGEVECLLLAVMAFDRYVAICHPLRYRVIMNWKTCKNITVILWVGSFLTASFPTIAKPPVFCKYNKVNHFLCEVLEVVKLACGDTSTYEKTIFFNSLFIIFTPFVFIVASYICIIKAVLKINSVDGRSKAFSTCVSHLTVVLMFYGTSMTMYLGPTNHFSPNQHKYFAVIYCIVTPMLNPLIYSLRNSEVKVKVWKLLTEIHSILAM